MELNSTQGTPGKESCTQLSLARSQCDQEVCLSTGRLEDSILRPANRPTGEEMRD